MKNVTRITNPDRSATRPYHPGNDGPNAAAGSRPESRSLADEGKGRRAEYSAQERKAHAEFSAEVARENREQGG